MLVFLFLPALALLSVLEPPDGKRVLAVSLADTAFPESPAGWRPTINPRIFNAQTKVNWGAYMFVQEIPETEAPRFDLLDDSNTDAAIYLSVLPTAGFDAITRADLVALVRRCAHLNSAGRDVFLRFAPDMNTPKDWYPWGQQPNKFLYHWKMLREILKSVPGADRTALVWAPHDGTLYPYDSKNQKGDDFICLDTNKDGKLDQYDDPYSPYFPGKDNVDWVGLSTFFAADRYPATTNFKPPSKFLNNVLTGATRPSNSNFYYVYSETFHLPMMISDIGASFYTQADSDLTPLTGDSELEIKSMFWRQWLTDSVFHQKFPRIKFFCVSEFYSVYKYGFLRLWQDMRVTNHSAILQPFQADLLSQDNIVWSNPAKIISWTAFKPDSPSSSSTDSKGPGFDITATMFLLMVPCLVIGIGVWTIYSVWQYKHRRPPSTSSCSSSFSNKEDVDDISTIYDSDTFDQRSRRSDQTSDDFLMREWDDHISSVIP